jgi:hypothetical protein
MPVDAIWQTVLPSFLLDMVNKFYIHKTFNMSLKINSKDLNTLIVEYVAQHKNCSDQRAKGRILEKLRYNHRKLIAENNFPISTVCKVILSDGYCDIVAYPIPQFNPQADEIFNVL